MRANTLHTLIRLLEDLKIQAMVFGFGDKLVDVEPGSKPYSAEYYDKYVRTGNFKPPRRSWPYKKTVRQINALEEVIRHLKERPKLPDSADVVQS